MAINDFRKEQNKKRELAYMRMVKQTMLPKSTEERERERAAEQEELEKSQTTGKKIGNFFYHNKIRIIVIVIAAVIVGILLYSLLSRPKYDMKLMMAYTAQMQEPEPYQQAFCKYIEDLDGNGEVAVEFLNVCLDPDQMGDSQIAQRASMTAYLQLGDVNLYLLDASMYEELVGQFEDCFVDLSELYPDVPQVDGKRFLLEGSALEKDLNVEVLPSEFCLVLRTEVHAGNKKESYEQSKQLLDRIIRGEPIA